MKRRAFLTMLAAGLTAGCGRQSSTTLGGVTMGTTFSITVPGTMGTASQAALRRDIESTLASIVRSMSTYEPTSELSRFNASNSTQWTFVSPDLFTVLVAASDTGGRTQGAFDVTVGPLIDLWGFGPKWRAAARPDPAALEAARGRIGQRFLELDPQSQAIRKQRPDVAVDLSSIGKGYGVDRVATLLEAHGIDSFLVEIGGEFRARGKSANQDPWRLGLEAPDARYNKIAGVIELRHGGIATSGNYRSFFDDGERRYPHVLDPITGEPINHPPLSVTVVAESAMQADALATALLVMGPDRGYQFANANGIAAIFIEALDGAGEAKFKVKGTAVAPSPTVL